MLRNSVEAFWIFFCEDNGEVVKMENDRKEIFVSIVSKKAGIPAQEVAEGLRTDPFYPVGERFEMGLAESVSKFARYAYLLDKMVEKKAMDLDEMLAATEEKLHESGVTWDDIEVTKTLYDSLTNLYGEEIDDDHVMPLAVEDLGDGLLVVKMSRVIKDMKKMAETPGEKINDYIENEPSHLLFIDTTPWKEGYMTFYTSV